MGKVLAISFSAGMYLSIRGLLNDDGTVLLVGCGLWLAPAILHFAASRQGDSPGAFVKLYYPSGEVELGILKSILDAEGINYFVQADSLGSILPGPKIEGYNYKSIYVTRSELERAEELVGDYISRTYPENRDLLAYPRREKVKAVAEALLFGWVTPKRMEFTELKDKRTTSRKTVRLLTYPFTGMLAYMALFTLTLTAYRLSVSVVPVPAALIKVLVIISHLPLIVFGPSVFHEIYESLGSASNISFFIKISFLSWSFLGLLLAFMINEAQSEKSPKGRRS